MTDMGQADKTLRQKPQGDDDGVFERFSELLRNLDPQLLEGYLAETEDNPYLFNPKETK